MLAGGFSYNGGHQEQAVALVWNERSVTSSYVGSKKVKGFNGEDCKAYPQHPVDIRPSPQPDLRQMYSAGQSFPEMGTYYHRGECNQEKPTNHQGEGHRQRPCPPKRAGLFGVVGEVESFDRGRESA